MRALVTNWISEDDIVTLYVKLEEYGIELHKDYDISAVAARVELNSLLNVYAPQQWPLIGKLGRLLNEHVHVHHYALATKIATNISPIL